MLQCDKKVFFSTNIYHLIFRYIKNILFATAYWNPTQLCISTLANNRPIWLSQRPSQHSSAHLHMQCTTTTKSLLNHRHLSGQWKEIIEIQIGWMHGGNNRTRRARTARSSAARSYMQMSQEWSRGCRTGRARSSLAASPATAAKAERKVFLSRGAGGRRFHVTGKCPRCKCAS